MQPGPIRVEQDRYVASLMDGIDDAPVYVFNDVQAFTVRFDFLSCGERDLAKPALG